MPEASRLPVSGRLARAAGLLAARAWRVVRVRRPRARAAERSGDAPDAGPADHRRGAGRRRRRDRRRAESRAARPAARGEPGAGRRDRHVGERGRGAQPPRRRPLLGRADLRTERARLRPDRRDRRDRRHRFGIDGHTTLRLAYALRLGRSAAIGAAWGHIWSGRFAGTDTFDFGLSARFGRYAALGVTVEDAWQPVVDAAAVERRAGGAPDRHRPARARARRRPRQRATSGGGSCRARACP